MRDNIDTLKGEEGLWTGFVMLKTETSGRLLFISFKPTFLISEI
jgi:hypothetical protein